MSWCGSSGDEHGFEKPWTKVRFLPVPLMQEIKDNLWTFDPGGIVVWRGIPTNGVVRNGKLVMGAGVAKDAKTKYPLLPEIFGRGVEEKGNIPIFAAPAVGECIFSFPTKNHYNNDSDINLITNSAAILAMKAMKYSECDFVMPRPGVGLGNLSWDEVRVSLLTLLPDNVYVVSL